MFPWSDRRRQVNNSQELRGGACSGPVSDPNAGFACGSVVRCISFSGTCCTTCNMFLKKKKIFRPAGGESDRSSRQSPGLDTHRVTRVIHRSYVVSNLEGHFASGRAEEPRSFSQKKSLCEFFCEKVTKVPCCRRRIGLSSSETSSLNTHRLTPVIQ